MPGSGPSHWAGVGGRGQERPGRQTGIQVISHIEYTYLTVTKQKGSIVGKWDPHCLSSHEELRETVVHPCSDPLKLGLWCVTCGGHDPLNNMRAGHSRSSDALLDAKTRYH